MTGHREGECHRRVKMGTGDMPGRIDHRHDDQPKRDCDSDMTEGTRLLVDDDCPWTGEDQSKGADRFGDELPQLGHALAPRLPMSSAHLGTLYLGIAHGLRART